MMDSSGGLASHVGVDGSSDCGVEPDSLSPYEQQLIHLERQLDIECKVKQGAENMIAKYSALSKDKKLHMEAQQMAIDSKAKIEYLRMKIMKIKQVSELHFLKTIMSVCMLYWVELSLSCSLLPPPFFYLFIFLLFRPLSSPPWLPVVSNYSFLWR
jgi:hypothetical protein